MFENLAYNLNRWMEHRQVEMGLIMLEAKSALGMKIFESRSEETVADVLAREEKERKEALVEEEKEEENASVKEEENVPVKEEKEEDAEKSEEDKNAEQEAPVEEKGAEIINEDEEEDENPETYSNPIADESGYQTGFKVYPDMILDLHETIIGTPDEIAAQYNQTNKEVVDTAKELGVTVQWLQKGLSEVEIIPRYYEESIKDFLKRAAYEIWKHEAIQKIAASMNVDSNKLKNNLADIFNKEDREENESVFDYVQRCVILYQTKHHVDKIDRKQKKEKVQKDKKEPRSAKRSNNGRTESVTLTQQQIQEMMNQQSPNPVANQKAAEFKNPYYEKLKSQEGDTVSNSQTASQTNESHTDFYVDPEAEKPMFTIGDVISGKTIHVNGEIKPQAATRRKNPDGMIVYEDEDGNIFENHMDKGETQQNTENGGN